jgi:hypothetical protein
MVDSATSITDWLPVSAFVNRVSKTAFSFSAACAENNPTKAAITTLRDKLNDGNRSAADRARLGALLSWAELRNPQENARAGHDLLR